MIRRTRSPGDSERGVALVNVLGVIALASVVVMMMITLQETGIARSGRYAEAAQALAYAEGGEASAVAALRRDLMQAPGSDCAAEAWGKLAETDRPIDAGTFSLAIEDAQARFNVNTLIRGGVAAQEILARIAVAAGARPGAAERIGAYVRELGPITSLEPLALVLDEDDLAALAPLLVALPEPTKVNLNTADGRVIAAVLNNDVSARILVRRRERGCLTPDDLSAARVIAPQGAGLTSSWFTVEADVRVGDTRQRLASLLRRSAAQGGAVVEAVERRR